MTSSVFSKRPCGTAVVRLARSQQHNQLTVSYTKGIIKGFPVATLLF
jgi:hypothetical protein